MKPNNFLLMVVLFLGTHSMAEGQRYDQYNQGNKNDPSNQNNQYRPLPIKRQILNKLDTIDQFYLSRLKNRERFEARRKLDAVAQLVDQLSDELRRKEIALAEMEKKLKSRDRDYDDRDRDKFADKDRFDDHRDKDRNIDRDKDRNIPRVSPISIVEFDQLVTSVEKTPFDNDKKIIVRTSATNNYFMVEQVIKIASKFSFDNDKLDVIQTLYPKIIDVDKNYLLYNCLTFSDGKNKLGKFIESNTPRK